MVVRKTKGKAGWFGQSKRHSEASVKGWNSRFGKKKVSLSQVKKINKARSNRAKTVDNQKNARVVGKNRYAQWAGNPARFDVEGVDTVIKIGSDEWRKRQNLADKFYEKYGIDNPSEYIPDKIYYPINKAIKSGEITSVSEVKKKIEELREKKSKKFKFDPSKPKIKVKEEKLFINDVGISAIVPKSKQFLKGFEDMTPEDEFDKTKSSEPFYIAFEVDKKKVKGVDFVDSVKRELSKRSNFVKITSKPDKKVVFESISREKHDKSYYGVSDKHSAVFPKDDLKILAGLISKTKPDNVSVWVQDGKPLFLSSQDFNYYLAPRIIR